MSTFLGFITSSRRSIISKSTVFLLIYFLPSVSSLQCHQHSLIERSKSPSMNTCVTTRYGYCVYKEVNGRVERNCDGNGVQQISVCKDLMEKDLEITREATVFDHRGLGNDARGRRGGCNPSSGFPCPKGPEFRPKTVSSNGPNDPRDQYTNPKLTRDRPPPSPRCFDTGQLGKICCCQGDRCNSSPHLSLLLLFLVSILHRL